MRPWQAWTIFAVLALVLISAMGWTSSAVLRLDRVQAKIDHDANMEVRVRLALWRMESVLTPLIAREAARPYSVYTATTRPAQESLGPWSVQGDASPHVLLYFQLGPDGELTSPQVIPGKPAAAGGAPRGEATLRQRVETLKSYLNYRKLDVLLARNETTRQSYGSAPEKAIRPAGQANLSGSQREAEYERRLGLSTRNILDYSEESAAGNTAGLTNLGQIALNSPFKTPYALAASLDWQGGISIIPTPAASGGLMRFGSLGPGAPERVPFNFGATPRALATAAGLTSSSALLAVSLFQMDLPKPVWVGDSLLLVRRATLNGKPYFQGCWLDWIALSTMLLDEVRDLLPEAVLEPVKDPVPIGRDRMLAAIPARLIPGQLGGPVTEFGYPIRLSLRLAWSGVVLAIMALGALLAGVLALGERRRTFVSSVTHELRTPLTTFRIYTEMLAGGMVIDEHKRSRYLMTLQAEATRLTHLVENVLSYARLEGGRAGSRSGPIAVGDLLDRIIPRLAERAQQVQLELEIEMENPLTELRADVAAVEQILFNLVDNACKYAAAGAQRKIRIESRREGNFMVLRLRDHGPGISPREGRRLFRPFSRSARDAAGNAPGVGLGLALSRRLARVMGGDLRLDPAHTAPGACFVLTLPLSY